MAKRVHQTKETKLAVVAMRKAGASYQAIADHFGITRASAQTICRNSGEFTDNQDHDKAFTIKPVSDCKALIKAVIPKQQLLTGDKVTDAYLWLLELAGLGTKETTKQATKLLKELCTSSGLNESEIQKGAHQYIIKRDGLESLGAFAAFKLPDTIKKHAKSAEDKKLLNDSSLVLFGSEEGCFNMLPTEKKLFDNSVKLYKSLVAKGITNARLSNGEQYLDLSDYIENNLLTVCGKLFAGIPKPHTIEQVCKELDYWEHLTDIRHAASKRIKIAMTGESNPEHHHIYDRKFYLYHLLETIKPAKQTERQRMIEIIWRDEERYINNGLSIMMNATR